MAGAARWSSSLSSALSSEVALRLAEDVLEDHFGGVVAIVGGLLMRRGALSVQEILRFCRHEHDDPGHEPLGFPRVRNSLLTLVQHGLAAVRPHPQALSNEALKGLLYVYTVNIDAVLARLRFPYFLEHCYWTFGGLPAELLSVVLKYGRVSEDHAINEVRGIAPEAPLKELKEDFRRLLTEQIIRPAQPFANVITGGIGGTSATASSSSTSPAPLPLEGQAAAAASGDGPAAKRRRQDGSGDGDAGAGDTGAGAAAGDAAGDAADSTDVVAAGALVTPSAPAKEAAAPSLFCCNTEFLALCVTKNLICRLIEERSPQAGQVVAALLSAVSPPQRETDGSTSSSASSSQEVQVEWLSFPVIEQRLRDMGMIAEGRDPVRERERIRQQLELMSRNKDGIFKKRAVPVGKSLPSQSSSSARGAAGAGGGRGRPRRASSAPALGAAGGAGAIAPMPPTGGVTAGKVDEWCVEWQKVRKVLVSSMTSQLVRDQFGTIGLRMFNLLSEGDPPQKLEESQIFATCMVQPQEGRELLNEMVRRSIISWQEVPRSANLPLAASFWLYYVDYKRLASTLLWISLQSVLNLRIRFRLEVAKNAPLESRASSLLRKERLALKEGRRFEDVLERAFLVLHIALLDFRST